jgi:hypothetical protein
MCEVFGVMDGAGDDVNRYMLREGLDMLAKGINFFVPHGTWYDPVNNVTFQPELSFRTERYAAPTRAFNDFVREFSPIMQSSTHYPDIAVVYPIHDLQAHSDFTHSGAYEGGFNPEHSDYLAVGEQIAYKYRGDFLFIHPETLLEWDLSRFETIVLPGMKYVSAATLEKLLDYKRAGGQVVATGLIPTMAVERGADERVRALAKQLFETPGNWMDGIRARRLSCDTVPERGNLSFICKKRDDGNLFYFVANSSDTALNAHLQAGEKDMAFAMEPLSGKIIEM